MLRNSMSLITHTELVGHPSFEQGPFSGRFVFSFLNKKKTNGLWLILQKNYKKLMSLHWDFRRLLKKKIAESIGSVYGTGIWSSPVIVQLCRKIITIS